MLRVPTTVLLTGIFCAVFAVAGIATTTGVPGNLIAQFVTRGRI